MASSSAPSRDWIFTRPQRRALIVLVAIFCAALAVIAAKNPAYIPDPQAGDGARAGELATLLDPNNATWEELAAVPMMGEKKAKAIVAFREKTQTGRAGGAVFQSVDDLTKVKGIGKAIAANIKPYLTFPAAAP